MDGFTHELHDVSGVQGMQGLHVGAQGSTQVAIGGQGSNRAPRNRRQFWQPSEPTVSIAIVVNTNSLFIIPTSRRIVFFNRCERTSQETTTRVFPGSCCPTRGALFREAMFVSGRHGNSTPRLVMCKRNVVFFWKTVSVDVTRHGCRLWATLGRVNVYVQPCPTVGITPNIPSRANNPPTSPQPSSRYNRYSALWSFLVEACLAEGNLATSRNPALRGAIAVPRFGSEFGINWYCVARRIGLGESHESQVL